jgi:formylglycine-generating enzyme required for sulfatase activity
MILASCSLIGGRVSADRSSMIVARTVLLWLCGVTCSARAHAQCIGNLNNDAAIDGADLGTLLGFWGPCLAECSADLNADGNVDGADLGLLLSRWGVCPGAPSWGSVVEWFPDPQVVTDAILRDRIIATGRPWRVRHIATQIELLLVPPGSFQMGCTPSEVYRCYSSEYPIHAVTLTSAFYLGRYEVTQGQWTGVMGSNPSYFQAPSLEVPVDLVAHRPVERVTWNMAQSFVVAAGFRLPTEAEWEYSCRAGTASAFNNGSSVDSTVGSIGWVGANSAGQTRPIGLKPGNRLGFHDMHGNVSEWVSDWYAPYTATAQVNPSGPLTGELRVSRGWGYPSFGDPSSLRSSARMSSYPSGWPSGPASFHGFRVAKEP